jgi:type I restriction-modification system DNA methylase subunit
MILHNIPDAHIENEDTLENPLFINEERNYIKQFDRVIANPPFLTKLFTHYDEISAALPSRLYP